MGLNKRPTTCEGDTTHDAAMKSSKQLTCTNNETPRSENSWIHAYLSFPGTRKVPFLAELAPASDVGNGEDPLAFLNECEDGSAEERVDGDVETSISCDP
jgi:hypothetical protein